jgi:hypothetical protein
MRDAGIVPGEWRDTIPLRFKLDNPARFVRQDLQLSVHLIALTYNTIVNWR